MVRKGKKEYFQKVRQVALAVQNNVQDTFRIDVSKKILFDKRCQLPVRDQGQK